MKRNDLPKPVTINAVETYFDETYSLDSVGGFVSVRPCGDEYKGNTYLGIMLGDMMQSAAACVTKEGVLELHPFTNPAMYVPSLNKVVWGCESWWHKISSPKELDQITDSDISEQWYMRLLKEMAGKAEEGKPI